MFAVTFHCMVEGDMHCQQHYMTDREEGVQGNSSLSDFSFVLFKKKTAFNLSLSVQN